VHDLLGTSGIWHLIGQALGQAKPIVDLAKQHRATVGGTLWGVEGHGDRDLGVKVELELGLDRGTL